MAPLEGEEVRGRRNIGAACVLGDAEGDADDRGGDDTDQEGALYLEGQQHTGDKQTEECEACVTLEPGRVQGDEGCSINDDTGILQADEGNEEADTYPDRFFDVIRNGVDDRLSHVHEGKDDEDDTFDEDRGEGELPTVAHSKNNGVRQEGVQSHARGESERQVGHQCHDQRGNGRRDCGGGEDLGELHPGIAENTRVHGQDISHGQECCNSCHHLYLNCSLPLLEFEKLFHLCTPYRCC